MISQQLTFPPLLIVGPRQPAITEQLICAVAEPLRAHLDAAHVDRRESGKQSAQIIGGDSGIRLQAADEDALFAGGGFGHCKKKN